MRWPLAPAGALLLVALLATWNLSAYPRSYYDEGINLHAARNLAHSGRYGLVYSRELRPFDVQLTTGPTVIAPAAVAFKAFGIGLAQGRAVMAAYLLLAAGGLFWVGTQLYGRTVGTVALLVLAASDNATPAEARFVVGEAAALAFILWGAALFASARAAGRVSGHLGAGLLFGLAILTKAQFGLLPLLLVALWLITRGRPGGFALRHLLLLLVALATPLALWQLYQLSALGPAGYAELIGQTRDVARVSSTVPPLRRTPEAMIYLLSAFPATLAVVGLAYVWLLLTRQDWRSQPAEHLLLPGLALVTLVWYAGLSMGWSRLITPTVAIASLFVAKLFCDLGRAAGVPPGPRRGLSWRWVTANPQAAGLLLLLAAPIACGIALNGFAVARLGNTWAQEMGARIGRDTPPDAIVESYEWELDILTDRAFHHPPPAVVVDAVGAVELRRPARLVRSYEAPAAASYLVDGPFSKLFRIYEHELGRGAFELVASVGDYDLYRRTGSPGSPG